jgi:hypothetical protein
MPEMDKYEKFLRGHMTARRLCQDTGFEGMANNLVPVLQGLQTAHERIVDQRVHEKCRTIMRCRVILTDYRAGKMTYEELKRALKLDDRYIEELLSGGNGSLREWVENGGEFKS